MSIGNTCGYLNVQGVEHSLAPPVIAPGAYIVIRVRLLRCSIVFKPLFNENFYSLFSCNFFAAWERRVKRLRPQVTTTQLS